MPRKNSKLLGAGTVGTVNGMVMERLAMAVTRALARSRPERLGALAAVAL